MQDNNLIDVNLTSEMKTSFIDYAMRLSSLGLSLTFGWFETVHRRILVWNE